jgi:galactose mutarotase-like enzyme
VTVAESSEHGFRALQVDNGRIGFTIVPELGAKLTSLRDVRFAHEWLWRSDQLEDRRHPYGTSYVEHADTGGWDECFPTVGACRFPSGPWAGAEMPDHGELWSQAWTTSVADDDGAVRVRAQAHGVQLSYEFARTIVLRDDSSTLELEYEVTSTAEHDMDFIWSAHPLFPLDPGGAVRLPAATRLHTFSSIDGTRPPAAEPFAFPFTVRGPTREIDLTTLPGGDAAIALKVWSEPLGDGWAELVNVGGRALRMSWDVDEIPQVGLWLNAGGWSGTGGAPYCNLALEPCIGAQDSLEDAVLRHRSHGTVPAGATARWRLDVTLS